LAWRQAGLELAAAGRRSFGNDCNVPSGNGATNMLARTSGLAWEVLAPAKLNLYLEVLGRRADGFHELDTVMTPVRIFDSLRWTPSPPAETAFSLRYDSSTPRELQTAAPADDTNLAWRAFAALASAAGIEPTGQVTLVKRIPVQAGLGGASSDAAAALSLGNAAWGLGFGRGRLAELAAELGSDVPFFLAGGPAICRGRGERVAAIDLPRLNVVVVKPPAGAPTAAAFHLLGAGPLSPVAAQDSRVRAADLVDNLRRGRLARAARQMVNRLQDAAARLCPTIERICAALARCGCVGPMVTGSGSACFGLACSARHARQVARQLSSWKLGTVFAAASLGAASPPL
jgi:4-diphosphocytidyl-2-C-methyl-D-erythritol kinase